MPLEHISLVVNSCNVITLILEHLLQIGENLMGDTADSLKL